MRIKAYSNLFLVYISLFLYGLTSQAAPLEFTLNRNDFLMLSLSKILPREASISDLQVLDEKQQASIDISPYISMSHKLLLNKLKINSEGEIVATDAGLRGHDLSVLKRKKEGGCTLIEIETETKPLINFEVLREEILNSDNDCFDYKLIENSMILLGRRKHTNGLFVCDIHKVDNILTRKCFDFQVGAMKTTNLDTIKPKLAHKIPGSVDSHLFSTNEEVLISEHHIIYFPEAEDPNLRNIFLLVSPDLNTVHELFVSDITIKDIYAIENKDRHKLPSKLIVVDKKAGSLDLWKVEISPVSKVLVNRGFKTSAELYLRDVSAASVAEFTLTVVYPSKEGEPASSKIVNINLHSWEETNTFHINETGFTSIQMIPKSVKFAAMLLQRDNGEGVIKFFNLQKDQNLKIPLKDVSKNLVFIRDPSENSYDLFFLYDIINSKIHHYKLKDSPMLRVGFRNVKTEEEKVELKLTLESKLYTSILIKLVDFSTVETSKLMAQQAIDKDSETDILSVRGNNLQFSEPLIRHLNTININPVDKLFPNCLPTRMRSGDKVLASQCHDDVILVHRLDSFKADSQVTSGIMKPISLNLLAIKSSIKDFMLVNDATLVFLLKNCSVAIQTIDFTIGVLQETIKIYPNEKFQGANCFLKNGQIYATEKIRDTAAIRIFYYDKKEGDDDKTLPFSLANWWPVKNAHVESTVVIPPWSKNMETYLYSVDKGNNFLLKIGSDNDGMTFWNYPLPLTNVANVIALGSSAYLIIQLDKNSPEFHALVEGVVITFPKSKQLEKKFSHLLAIEYSYQSDVFVIVYETKVRTVRAAVYRATIDPLSRQHSDFLISKESCEKIGTALFNVSPKIKEFFVSCVSNVNVILQGWTISLTPVSIRALDYHINWSELKINHQLANWNPESRKPLVTSMKGHVNKMLTENEVPEKSSSTSKFTLTNHFDLLKNLQGFKTEKANLKVAGDSVSIVYANKYFEDGNLVAQKPDDYDCEGVSVSRFGDKYPPNLLNPMLLCHSRNLNKQHFVDTEANQIDHPWSSYSPYTAKTTDSFAFLLDQSNVILISKLKGSNTVEFKRAIYKSNGNQEGSSLQVTSTNRVNLLIEGAGDLEVTDFFTFYDQQSTTLWIAFHAQRDSTIYLSTVDQNTLTFSWDATIKFRLQTYATHQLTKVRFFIEKGILKAVAVSEFNAFNIQFGSPTNWELKIDDEYKYAPMSIDEDIKISVGPNFFGVLRTSKITALGSEIAVFKRGITKGKKKQARAILSNNQIDLSREILLDFAVVDSHSKKGATVIVLIEEIVEAAPVEKRNLVVKEFSTSSANPDLKIFNRSLADKFRNLLAKLFGTSKYLSMKSKDSIFLSNWFLVSCIVAASLVLVACMAWLIIKVKKSSITTSQAEQELYPTRGLTVATINI